MENFLGYNSMTKGFPDMPFLQNDNPEQYYTNDFEINLMRTLFNKLEISLGHFSNRAGKSTCC